MTPSEGRWMRFTPEAMDTELPEILSQFVNIAGRDGWKKRLRWLEREVRRETGMRHFWRERCPLELGFSRMWRHLRKTGGVPFDIADEDARRFLSFAAMTVRCHRRLTPKARKRLAGMLRSATKGDFGLGPVAYEMKLAVHLLGRDYDVVFHDLESGGGYDLLATKGGLTLEVECTHMSGDAGRKIHRKELYRFADRFSPWMRDHLGNLSTGLFARLTIPGRLESADAYQKPLCALVGRALLGGGTDWEQDGARVRVEAFDVERVAGPWAARGDAFGRAAMEARLLDHFDLVNKNVLVYVRPGRSVVVLLIVSDQPDEVLNGMHAELRRKTKGQFTGRRPAILCCHLADLTQAQLLSLAEGGVGTGLDYLATDLMVRRPHLCSVTYTAAGGTGEVDAVQSMREKGPAYTVVNPDHPLAGDKRLSVFRDGWPPEWR